MTKIIFVRILILLTVIIPYLILTIKYFRVLQKEKIFKKGVKLFHMIMIWLVPFVWIWLLKALTKPTPGSYQIEEKSDPQPFAKYREGTL